MTKRKLPSAEILYGLYAGGMPQRAIAAKYGVRKTSVQTRLDLDAKRYGWAYPLKIDPTIRVNAMLEARGTVNALGVRGEVQETILATGVWQKEIARIAKISESTLVEFMTIPSRRILQRVADAVLKACDQINAGEVEFGRQKVKRLRGLGPSATREYCPQGHKYSPNNTHVRVRPNGKKSRHCRVCGAARRARYRAKMREDGQDKAA